jgi:hypothetical protein
MFFQQWLNSEFLKAIIARKWLLPCVDATMLNQSDSFLETTATNCTFVWRIFRVDPFMLKQTG